jgi:hypothetical protein
MSWLILVLFVILVCSDDYNVDVNGENKPNCGTVELKCLSISELIMRNISMNIIPGAGRYNEVFYSFFFFLVFFLD